MAIKKIINEKIVTFDFLADLLKSEFLYTLCMECDLSNIIYRDLKSSMNNHISDIIN